MDLFYKVHLPDHDHPGEPNVMDLEDGREAAQCAMTTMAFWYLSAPDDANDEDRVKDWHDARPLFASNDANWSLQSATALANLGLQILGQERLKALIDVIERLQASGELEDPQAQMARIFGFEQHEGHAPGCDGKCNERHEDGMKEALGVPANYSPVAEMETFLTAMTKTNDL